MSLGGVRTSIIALAALLVIALAASPAEAAKPPRVGGCPIFPAFTGPATAPSAADQTAWNQDVSRAPIDPRSGAYIHGITRLGGNQVVHPDFGGNGRYGIPYNTVGRDQRQVRVHVTAYPGESDFGRAPIPPHARVEGGSDRHVLVLQRGVCDLFEMFGAHYVGGKGHRWNAASTAKFNLHSTKLRHDGWTSADAAGLPILPGLVRYGEVKRGHVRHAIRATFSETRKAYIHPATHYASDRCARDLPPMGLRLRLSQGYYEQNLHRFPKGSQSRVIFTALYHYGIINADNGGTGSNWFITGATSKRWRDGDLNRLKSVPGSAFVVVESQAPVQDAVLARRSGIALCVAGAAAAFLLVGASAALAAPSTPRNFRVTRTATHSISLAWSQVASETRYEIVRDGSVTKQAPQNATSLADSGLAAGTRHSYSIRACNASGCSAPSPARTQATLLAPFKDPYPSLGACHVFPPYTGSPTAPSAANQTAWNQDISKAPVDPRSSKYLAKIRSLGGNQFIHPDFGSNPTYGIPYVVVPGVQPRVPTRFTLYGDESDPGPYPIPPHAPIEAGSDHHVLVVDRDHCSLYETGGSRYVGGTSNSWKAWGGALFNLNRAGPLRPDFWTSADAAGLPIFPGLVRYDQVASGHLDHAIRVTFDQTQRAFIHPATHYASDSCNPNLPPMGLRLRLKASYNLSHFTGEALVIAKALKRYGIINADNGSNWFITGATDSRWDDENLDQLKSIPGSAFQVVKSAAKPEVASDC